MLAAMGSAAGRERMLSPPALALPQLCTLSSYWPSSSSSSYHHCLSLSPKFSRRGRLSSRRPDKAYPRPRLPQDLIRSKGRGVVITAVSRCQVGSWHCVTACVTDVGPRGVAVARGRVIRIGYTLDHSACSPFSPTLVLAVVGRLFFFFL